MPVSTGTRLSGGGEFSGMLTVDLDSESNPLIVADAITIFISDGLRNGTISLYSAFLLNHDVLRLRRLGYRQPAWQCRLSISGVLALYMQYLFGLAIGEAKVATVVSGWLGADVSLIAEKRDHYIREYLGRLPDIEPSREQLTELSRIRSEYPTLSDDDGPYHTEVFPYDYFSPEDVLLGRSSAGVDKSRIEPDAESLMLAISSWG